MFKPRTLLRRFARKFLPLKLQVLIGVTVLRASVNPLAPVLSGLSRNGPISVIEIGTRWGDSLRYIAARFPVSSYLAIDPFTEYDDYAGDGFDQILREQDADSIFRSTQTLGAKLLGKRFQLLRAFSSDVADLLDDAGADFIFVDGNHRFDFVLEDLKNYWPKVKPGGYLCGHDFFMRSHSAGPGGDYNEPMVYEAVQAFATEHKVPILTFGEHRELPMCFALKKASPARHPA